MCGIAGILAWDGRLALEELEHRACAMAESAAHRGPDDAGMWSDPGGGLAMAHTRLSILDTSSRGRQPLLNEDQTLAVACNGEIYNAPALRTGLEARGHVFHSQSDSETIVHTLEESFSARGVRALDGMFGLAAWNAQSKTLLLARDPFGKKPLYYAQGNGWFAFSSELSGLALLPEFDARMSRDRLAKYLILQYVPAPETIFLGACKLPPGCMLTVKPGARPRIQRYFRNRFFPTDPGFPAPGRRFFCLGTTRPRFSKTQDRVEILRNMLVEAAGRRLASDVPLGAFLSGGVDSSLVAAIVRRELGRNMNTFSIGFEGSPESEHPYARQTAEHLGTRHHERLLSPDVLESVRLVAGLLDEPNGDSSCLPTLLLSEFAREQVTVALSGDGADEMFGGYGRYFDALTAMEKGDLAASYMTWRIFVFEPDHVDWLMGGMPGETRRYLRGWRSFLNARRYPPVHRLRRLDAATYMPGAVLAKVDRMSMRHALEVRCPFLDRRVAGFAAGLAPGECVRGKQGKLLLKQLGERYYPREWLDRPKTGFGLPMSFWRPEELVRFAEAVVLEPGGCLIDLLERERLERYFQEIRDPARFSVYQLWSLLVLEFWLRGRSGSHVPAHVPPEKYIRTGGR